MDMSSYIDCNGKSKLSVKNNCRCVVLRAGMGYVVQGITLHFEMWGLHPLIETLQVDHRSHLTILFGHQEYC